MTRVLVVGAAIVRDGQVLAARRTSPPAAAGRWEFPGGKVEPGEAPADAVVRELHEELGIVARVTGWLDGAATVSATHELRVAVCATAEAPVPTEHDLLRWLGPDQLGEVAWMEPDLPFLPELKQLLGGPPAAEPDPA